MSHPPAPERADEIFFHTQNRLACAFPYTVLAGGHTRATPAQAPVRRQFHQHVLILTLAGEGRLELAGRSFVAVPNSLAWLDTAAPYAHRCHSGGADWRYLWMGVQGFGLDALFSFARARLHPIFMVQGLDAVAQIFEEVLCSLQQRLTRADGVCSARVGQLLALMMAGRELPGHSEPVQARIERLMHAVAGKLAHPWHIDELARLASLSASQLHRQFRQSAGTSPMNWLRFERLNAAKQDLVASNEPVSVIATRCGYPDPYHFSRDFRRVTGQSPSRFRRSGGL